MATTALLLTLGCAIAFGQTAAVPEKFEVAAIKPCISAPGGRSGGSADDERVTSGRLSLCRSVHTLINLAYVTFASGNRDVPDFVPITGGPAWITSEQYNIDAKAEGNPSPQRMKGPMLQRLLEERFQLRIHRETRDGAAYALTVGKNGDKLQQAKECMPLDRTKPLEPFRPGQKLFCGSPGRSGIIASGGANIVFDAHGLTLAEFSKSLASILGRPVIDQTGLAGEFDFDLEFHPDESTPGLRVRMTGSDGPGGLSIFPALQEQLGLRLESTRGPGEFLIIDRVERPSEN